MCSRASRTTQIARFGQLIGRPGQHVRMAFGETADSFVQHPCKLSVQRAFLSSSITLAARRRASRECRSIRDIHHQATEPGDCYMRPLQALTHSLRHGSSPDHTASPRNIELSVQAGPSRTASRHDAQVLVRRTVPADPYTVWLERREADREREEHRLNPRDAWDNLRTQSFCAVGRGAVGTPTR